MLHSGPPHCVLLWIKVSSMLNSLIFFIDELILIVSQKEKFPSKLSRKITIQFSSVQSLSRVWLFATPRIVAHQASLSITNSQSSLKFTSIESVIPSSHLILYCPLLLLSPIPPSIRVFSNNSTLQMRWLKYWSFSFSISPSKDWFPLEWTG